MARGNIAKESVVAKMKSVFGEDYACDHCFNNECFCL